MPRDIRYIPPNSLVEVSNRTVDGRFFMTPGREVDEIIQGVLAKAAQIHRMRVVAFVFMSTHYHGLLQPRDADQLAAFMETLDGEIAKELNRLHRRRGPLWQGRYRGVVVSDEEAAQVARLRYILENGVKENLIDSPEQWPGVTSTPALLHGGEVEGVWFDRTEEGRARRRGERFGRYDHTIVYVFVLSPLPCWAHLSEAEYRRRIAELCKAIKYEHRERRRKAGKSVLGPDRLVDQDPYRTADDLDRSPAPRFHTATPEIRVMLEREYQEFASTYREAADNLRAGRPYRFPGGCFPPALPFQPNRPPPFAPPA